MHPRVILPESCASEDESQVNEMFPAIQNSIGTAPEAISVPRKPVCEVSEHCHSHQINIKLNTVQQTQGYTSTTTATTITATKQVLGKRCHYIFAHNFAKQASYQKKLSLPDLAVNVQ